MGTNAMFQEFQGQTVATLNHCARECAQVLLCVSFSYSAENQHCLLHWKDENEITLNANETYRFYQIQN